jgi:hypothetical protein
MVSSTKVLGPEKDCAGKGQQHIQKTDPPSRERGRPQKQDRNYVRFEVFTAVTMKNAVFWDVAPCRSGVTRRFGGTYRLHLQGRRCHIPEDCFLQDRNCQTIIKIWSQAQDGCSMPRQTGRLNVGRKMSQLEPVLCKM